MNELTTTQTLTVDQQLDLLAEATRQGFIRHTAERKAETERLAANRIAREQAVAAGLLTKEEAAKLAREDLMAGASAGRVIESTAQVIEEPATPAPQPTRKPRARYRCAGCGAKMALQQLCDDCRATRQEARNWAAVGYWLPTMQRQMDAYLAQYEAGLPDPEPEPTCTEDEFDALVAEALAQALADEEAALHTLEAQEDAATVLPEPEPPAPLPEKETRSRWERKSHYHQVASARRAEKRGVYVVNRADERADWEGHFGGDAA